MSDICKSASTLHQERTIDKTIDQINEMLKVNGELIATNERTLRTLKQPPKSRAEIRSCC